MAAGDLIGSRFGRLVVTGLGSWYVPPSGRRTQRVACKCDCGNTIEARTTSLRSGSTNSCGCLRAEMYEQGNPKRRTHGESRHRLSKTYFPEYVAWASMVQRCTNPKAQQWEYYGGRGITVCAEWLESYEIFLAHVGRRPSPKHSLARIKKDGDYEPGNVRWARRKHRNSNRRAKA